VRWITQQQQQQQHGCTGVQQQTLKIRKHWRCLSQNATMRTVQRPQSLLQCASTLRLALSIHRVCSSGDGAPVCTGNTPRHRCKTRKCCNNDSMHKQDPSCQQGKYYMVLKPRHGCIAAAAAAAAVHPSRPWVVGLLSVSRLGVADCCPVHAPGSLLSPAAGDACTGAPRLDGRAAVPSDFIRVSQVVPPGTQEARQNSSARQSSTVS
jgi:hypothetical protein